MFRALRFKRLCAVFALALAFALPATAHTGSALDLWQAWQLALQRDPIYAAQGASTQADQEQMAQARAQLLPHIDAVSGLQHNDIRRASTLSHQRNQRPNEWHLRLKQPLFDLAAVAKLERSKYLAAAAVIEQEKARNDLFLRLSQAYFDVLTAQDSLASLAAEQRAIEQQLRLAHQEFELGGATITDSYEAQSRLDLLTNQRISTENLLQNHKNQLSRIIGQRVGQLAPLNPNAELQAPTPTQLDDWLAHATAGNLAIAKSQLTIQAQQQQLNAHRREHAPTLSLQAQSGSQSNQGIHGNNNGSRALQSSVGIELSIPIYQGGATSSKVREQASLLSRANYDYENASRQTTEQVSNYFHSIHNGLQQVNALQSAEDTSQAAVDANQTAYEIGARTNIDVLNAQQQLYETQRALAKARYDILLNSIKLKSSVGQLQDDDIEAISRLLIPAP